MKYLAAALVVLALVGVMLVGDLGYIASADDRRSWSLTGTIALIWFVWLISRREP